MAGLLWIRDTEVLWRVKELEERIRNMVPNAALDEGDEQTSALRNAIQKAFPVVVYEGPITRSDGAWLPELTDENAIHDDDKFVYEALKDRKWTDVPKEFLHQEPDGYLLLTDEALVSYLAAWLMCSLDDIGDENLVRDYLTYAFSPSAEDWIREFKLNLVRSLNSEQRAVLRLLMVDFAQREPSEFVRSHAAAAVGFIDSCQ
jgi:hypothetical protein